MVGGGRPWQVMVRDDKKTHQSGYLRGLSATGMETGTSLVPKGIGERSPFSKWGGSGG